MKLKFSEIERRAPAGPGIYEVHMLNGTPLKVGIGVNLKKRLIRHRASGGLRLKPGGAWADPTDVRSKSSILAKHLYYDTSITKKYNLRTQEGRRAFLLECCYVAVQPTRSKEDARGLERIKELSGQFRYRGAVTKR
jgi:hypothetical protein